MTSDDLKTCESANGGLRVIRPHMDLATPVNDDHGFVFDGDYLVINWSKHPYELHVDQVSTPAQACRWIAHLGRKSTKAWSGMTPRNISAFLDALDARFGWGMWNQ